MAKVAVRQEPDKLNLEETELRLGLPMPRGSDGQSFKSSTSCFGGKRGFSQTVDFKLNLSSSSSSSSSQGSMEGDDDGASNKDKNFLPCANDPAKPPPKAQVVGWPPVRSYRKNILAVQKSGSAGETETEKHGNINSNATFVKVSMDGAPYLRKVDLKMYKTYQELSKALANLFSSFTTTTTGAGGSEATVKDFMNEIKLKDKQNGSDYVVSYEDKDGDWMLIGDVPWGMFVESCKRLRIMKGSEAIGLAAPRAMEKYKNRSWSLKISTHC